MAKVVYIAEKHNVGKVIAEHLWGTGYSSRKEGGAKGNLYRGTYNGDEVVVTWAHGHILQDALPPDYDEKFTDPFLYPVIPSLNTWKLLPDPQTKDLLDTICKEVKDADIVVNGGDPDREGQLLVDEILVYLGYRGQSRRIMIDAWDEKNVTRAFENMDDNAKPVHRNMYFAGLARKVADWLVGMNFCRAYSAAARKAGCYEYLNIGRVKSWVLGMVVRREREIANFKSKKYYQLDGHYVKDGISFSARFQPDESMLDEENRICGPSAYADLKSIADSLMSAPAVVQDVSRRKGTESAPLPFSLDTLQVAGSHKFGFSPQRVLDITQILYEKKFVSYPRSDCQYIPPSQQVDGREILSMLSSFGFKEAVGADPSLVSKCFNEKKVTAHHAIIPTSVMPSGLDDDQEKIYGLIATRYIQQFYPVCTFDMVEYTILAGGKHLFKGSGKVVIDPGFRKVFAVEKDDDPADVKEGRIPAIVKGETLVLGPEGYVVVSLDTKPPAYFREDSIIKAMTNVWRFVDKKETITIDGQSRLLKDVLKECNGIGTPATRGTILEDLKKDYRYIYKDGKKVKWPKEPCLVVNKKKELRPTAFGMQLVDSLFDGILDTSMTARMEFNLKRIAEGSFNINDYVLKVVDFVNEGIRYAEDNVSKMQPTSNGMGGGSKVSDVVCPVCGKGRLRLARFKGNEELKLPPFEAWICNDKGCLDSNGVIKYWGTSDKPVVEKCPVCSRPMKAVRTKAGLKKWVCFHGKEDQIEGSLWLDVASSGKAAKSEKCPVCGGVLRKVNTQYGLKWVCDHGKKGSVLWLDDVKGKPARYVPCPECGAQMHFFDKGEKKFYMCNHGVKGGKALFVDCDSKGEPVGSKKG